MTPMTNQSLEELVNNLYLEIQNEILNGVDDGFYAGIVKGNKEKGYHISLNDDNAGELLREFQQDQERIRPDCVIIGTQVLMQRKSGKWLERLICVGQMKTGFKYIRESVITRRNVYAESLSGDPELIDEDVIFSPSICLFSHVSDLDDYINIRT